LLLFWCFCVQFLLALAVYTVSFSRNLSPPLPISQESFPILSDPWLEMAETFGRVAAIGTERAERVHLLLVTLSPSHLVTLSPVTFLALTTMLTHPNPS
jgi:hypothetical protein